MIDIGSGIFRSIESEDEWQERLRQDQLCYCGLDWQTHPEHPDRG